MLREGERRRALIAAGTVAAEPLRHLFSERPLDAWDTIEADSFSRARFLLQHDSCDILVINHDLLEREGAQGLAWLACHAEAPMVFLAGPYPQHFQKAYELGASITLPREMALEHAPALASALDQALRVDAMRHLSRKTTERLADSRQHVDRLVNMIWRTTSRQAENPWFSQRSMLERLGEELARVERHQVPLTLALGEIQPPTEAEPKKARTLPEWAMDLLAKGKRRCDVVGQYGMGGFMLLMVQTTIQGAIHCCRRLQKSIEHPGEGLAGPHIGVHAYFGVSGTTTGKTSAVALLRSAEQNLEAARADQNQHLVVENSLLLTTD